MEYMVKDDTNPTTYRYFYITEEGARIIWGAYHKLYPGQSFERFWERGGTSVLEIAHFRDKGALPKKFLWTPYIIRDKTNYI